MDRKFFISHSSADREFVVWLAAELITLSIPVWYSDWEIKVGDSIVEKIDSALEDMAGLVVVLSASSVQSIWVREELNAALSRKLEGQNLPVFPIRIDQVEAPPLIGHRRYADFSQDRLSALEELAEAMVPAATVIQRIRDLKAQCVPLLNRLKAATNLDDDERTIILGVSSLLERAVEERYSIELRNDRPDRFWRATHPERFEYLVNRGYALSSDRWRRLVELRTAYLHRLAYIGHTLHGHSILQELLPDADVPNDPVAVQRVAWLETIFDELINGPTERQPNDTG